MLGIGRMLKGYGLWRKIAPIFKALEKEENMARLGSRKLWVTVGVAALGALLTQIGVSEGQTQQLLDWLQNLTWGYLASQGAVDAVGAIKGNGSGT